MTKTERILKNIEGLDLKEREEVLQYLLQKRKQQEDVKMKLGAYKGRGKGVWQQDAQEFVNQLRDDDRF